MIKRISSLFVFSLFTVSCNALPTSSIVGKTIAYLLMATDTIQRSFLYATSKQSISLHSQPITHAGVKACITEQIEMMAPELASTIDVRIADESLISNNMIAAAYFHNTLLITKQYYSDIEPLFEKEELSKDDNDTLDVFCFVIQHELAHITYNHVNTRQYLSAALLAPRIGLYEAISSRLNFFGSTFLTFICVNSIISKAQFKLYRHQEHSCDLAAMSERARRGGIIFCQRMMAGLKNDPFMATVDKMAITHPCIQDRLNLMQQTWGPQCCVAGILQ